MTIVLMEIDYGRKKEGSISAAVEYLSCGAGKTKCLECGGTGDWPYGPTPDTCGPCIDCKGTGFILVSV